MFVCSAYILNIAMHSFQEYCSILESLDTPYQWHTEPSGHGGNYHAVFAVPAGAASSSPLRYSVTFAEHREQNILDTEHPWELTFSLRSGARPHAVGTPKHDVGSDSNWTQDVTHTGHAFTIFATVIAIMKAFIAKQHPTIIYFSASEPSRMKLYDRFVKNVSSAVPGYRGYKLTTAMSRANGYGSDGPDWLTPNGYVIASHKISLKM